MTNPFNTEQGAEIGDRLNPLVAGSARPTGRPARRADHRLPIERLTTAKAHRG